MRTHHGRALALAVLLVLGACGPGQEAADPTGPTTTASEPSATPTIQDVMELEKFAPLEPGTYFIDPDSDPSTPLRVVYEVPVEGSQWFGALKFAEDGHVMINITTVVNLVRHGCRDHSWADPPVGPSVDDLAVALADLAPFRVTSTPTDVTMYGYRGKYLELTVPDLPVEGDDFIGCVDGNLLSWVAPIDVAEGEGGAFHGYNAEPVEEFWILDVDGTRLVIEANWSPASPRKDVAEMRAILDSIQIEP
ncbi:MAG: hypothetical protein XU10_C0044G0006 [Chloroflexi bacterium CSP1-4]|nr:MAG: hypothetical protein XU10_C0044G0006 [Chloroflexi bacterium CSP1-4]